MTMQKKELSNILYKPSYFNGFEKTKEVRGQKKTLKNLLLTIVYANVLTPEKV